MQFLQNKREKRRENQNKNQNKEVPAPIFIFGR